MLASGQFDLDIRNAQTEGTPFDINDGVVTVVNASVLNLELSNVFLFVGVNGAFEKDDNGSVSGLDTDDAIGFSVSGAGLALASISETPTPGSMVPVRSFSGIRASIDELAVHGLPNTFEFAVRDLLLRLNVPFTDTSSNETRLDWDALTAAGEVFGLEGVDASIGIAVNGYLELNIDGFVLTAGRFDISQTLEMIDDGTVPAFEASVLSIDLNDVHAFRGSQWSVHAKRGRRSRRLCGQQRHGRVGIRRRSFDAGEWWAKCCRPARPPRREVGLRLEPRSGH